jgi:hypothetical protein
MSTSKLIRWSGGALLLAGIMIAVPVIFHPDDVAHPETVLGTTWVAVHGFFAAGAVLALLGLTGLFARQAEEAGKLWLIGFLLTFTGTALLVAVLVVEAFVVPIIAAEAPKLLDPSGPLLGGSLGVVFLLAGIIFALGAILFGIVIVRAGVLPRLSALPFIVGAPLLAFWPPLPYLVGVAGGVLVGIGFCWMGYALFSGGHVVGSLRSAKSESVLR